MTRLAPVVMACTAMILTVLVVLDRRDRPPGVLEAGDRFPTLTLADSAGQEVSPLARDGDDLVVFFSMTCEYCIASLPVLREIARKRCDLGVTIVFLDVSGREMDEWWTAKGLSDACGPISFGSLVGLPTTFGVSGTPTFYLLSKNRSIVHRAIGGLTEVPEWLQ
jgi:thiol-disulfide isomerase/thioredoxin